MRTNRRDNQAEEQHRAARDGQFLPSEHRFNLGFVAEKTIDQTAQHHTRNHRRQHAQAHGFPHERTTNEAPRRTDEFHRVNASRFFAKAVFGEEQANALVDFYNEPLAVISAVGQYFDIRLKKLITKAQKRK